MENENCQRKVIPDVLKVLWSMTYTSFLYQQSPPSGLNMSELVRATSTREYSEQQTVTISFWRRKVCSRGWYPYTSVWTLSGKRYCSVPRNSVKLGLWWPASNIKSQLGHPVARVWAESIGRELQPNASSTENTCNNVKNNDNREPTTKWYCSVRKEWNLNQWFNKRTLHRLASSWKTWKSLVLVKTKVSQSFI